MSIPTALSLNFSKADTLLFIFSVKEVKSFLSSFNSLYIKYCNAIDGARTLECIANCDIVYILYSKSWSILPSCNDGTSKNGYSEYRSFGVIDGVGIEENRSCNGYF